MTDSLTTYLDFTISYRSQIDFTVRRRNFSDDGIILKYPSGLTPHASLLNSDQAGPFLNTDTGAVSRKVDVRIV